jgi:hypothetical protein
VRKRRARRRQKESVVNSEDVVTESARTRSTVSDGLDRLMSVSADRVFAPPEHVGERVVIPAARIDYSGGFGLGIEGNEGDGGPSGRRTGHRVAVIEAGPDGVRVRPVIDVGRVGLALAAAGFAVWTASRSRRRR